MRYSASLRDFGILVAIPALLSVSTATHAALIAQDGPHSGYNILPFSESSGPGRYQQIYSASLFSTPARIRSIAFSTDQPADYSANVSIRFATTTHAVGGLNTHLDGNFSGPLTEVFSDGAYARFLSGGSEAFSLVFDFSSTPYDFSPADGNLLLDILVSDQHLYPRQYPAFTAFSQAGQSATVYSRAWNFPTIAAFPFGADGAGLRTRFELEPLATVPIPAALPLLSGGTGVLYALAGLRRSSKHRQAGSAARSGEPGSLRRRTRTDRWTRVLAGAALAIGMSTGVQADSWLFTGALNTEQAAATHALALPDPYFGGGIALATLDDRTGDFFLQIFYAGLSAPALAAHVHDAPAGAEGAIVLDLGAPTPPVFPGLDSYFFSTLLSAADLDGLTYDAGGAYTAGVATNWYVNLHTPANPAGELRGQLFVGNVTTTTVPLPGAMWLLLPAVGAVLRHRRVEPAAR